MMHVANKWIIEGSGEVDEEGMKSPWNLPLRLSEWWLLLRNLASISCRSHTLVVMKMRVVGKRRKKEKKKKEEEKKGSRRKR